MAPSTVYTRASASLATTSNPSVLRSLTAAGIKRHRLIPVRHLWWWSRHGTWSSATDESIEERMQRHQKILRHRYSRALRRRAMWDREDNAPSWLCHSADGRSSRRWNGCRTISSSDPSRARLEEKQDDNPNQQDYWAKTKKDFEKFDQDFESFKAAVDRAIQTDPYSALFGRRLRSPPSVNNSSWISWLFNRNEPMPSKDVQNLSPSDTKKIEIEVLGNDGSLIKPRPQETSGAETSMAKKAKPVAEVEYTYDPISGRKIPRTLKVENIEQPNKTFFENLFSEHGSPPEKPIKQHRVYGHDSKPSETLKGSEKAATGNLSSNKRGFESSRTHEYQKLRASILGNSIDTAAEFGGKFDTDPTINSNETEKPTRSMVHHEEGTPLFSGTAYESKADEIMQNSDKKVDSWLEKEGFRVHNPAKPNINATSKESTRLEPSLDRIQLKPGASQQEKFIFKLQPAVDRIQVSKPREIIKSTPVPLDISTVTERKPQHVVLAVNQIAPLESDQREDVDLLRASDVRAATRAIRTTKQEAAQAKTETRSQLETEFDKIHNKQTDEVVSDAKQLRADSSRLSSRSIDIVRKHAEKYPDGVVAKTMNSMGMAFKNYSKPYTANRLDLTERLEFETNSLENLPSIYKQQSQKRAAGNTEVSQNVVDEQKAREELTESHRLASQQVNDIKRKENAQIEMLAKDIRHIYEAEHGPIDLSLNHTSMPKAEASEQAENLTLDIKASPETATDFFAAKEQFISEVNQVSKDVKSVKERAGRLETGIKNNTITPSEASTKVENLTAEAKSYLHKVNSLHEMYDRNQGAPHPLSSATVKPGVLRYPDIERHTQVFEPRYIQLLNEVKSVKTDLQNIRANLHDLKRSKVARDHDKPRNNQPAAEEPKSAAEAEHQIASRSGVPSSPYLILVYDKSTGEVQQTAMERLPWTLTEKVEKANAIRIMGNLNYPAAFVTHFVNLEKAGYELSSGGGDMLIFQRKIVAPVLVDGKPHGSIAAAPKALRNVIAADEASSQPEITETIAQPKGTQSKQAATVLDDIPVDIPPPGPAAPTAPPTTSPIRKTPRPGPRVRRQEQVFSGTIPVRPTPNSSRPKEESNESDSRKQSNEEDPSIFRRTTRTLKRGVLGVAAFGAAAYTIGVVAEGIGAQAQIEGDATAGPRRKIVMPIGQRAGIYSTESSRAD